MLSCVPFHPLCRLTKCTVVGTALSPTSTVGILAVGPGVSQALFSPGHQHRSTEVRFQDCSSHAPGPAMGVMHAAQILAQPSPCVYMPTKPTAAGARPTPAAGALIHLDIPQTLSLQSQQRECKSVVPAAMRRDFSSSSLVHGPWGSTVVSAPFPCVGHSQAFAPEAALEHTHQPKWEEWRQWWAGCRSLFM